MANEEVCRRNKNNRRRGKNWERTLRDGYRKAGHDTEHHKDTGTRDQGDLAIRTKGGRHFVVEAKDKALNVTGFLAEAKVERVNYIEARPYLKQEDVFGIVEWKRRGMTFDGGVILMDKAEFLRLLEAL